MKQFRKHTGGKYRNPDTKQKNESSKVTCSRCTCVHEHEACSARGKRCRKYNKMGHFEVACKTKTVKEKISDRQYDETMGMWFLWECGFWGQYLMITMIMSGM